MLQQFSDVGHAMLTMFTYALGGVELDIMLGSSNPEASIVLSLLYQFAMGTVLMSLLTGWCGASRGVQAWWQGVQGIQEDMGRQQWCIQFPIVGVQQVHACATMCNVHVLPCGQKGAVGIVP